MKRYNKSIKNILTVLLCYVACVMIYILQPNSVSRQDTYDTSSVTRLCLFQDGLRGLSIGHSLDHSKSTLYLNYHRAYEMPVCIRTSPKIPQPYVNIPITDENGSSYNLDDLYGQLVYANVDNWLPRYELSCINADICCFNIVCIYIFQTSQEARSADTPTAHARRMYDLCTHTDLSIYGCSVVVCRSGLPVCLVGCLHAIFSDSRLMYIVAWCITSTYVVPILVETDNVQLLPYNPYIDYYMLQHRLCFVNTSPSLICSYSERVGRLSGSLISLSSEELRQSHTKIVKMSLFMNYVLHSYTPVLMYGNLFNTLYAFLLQASVATSALCGTLCYAGRVEIWTSSCVTNHLHRCQCPLRVAECHARLAPKTIICYSPPNVNTCVISDINVILYNRRSCYQCPSLALLYRSYNIIFVCNYIMICYMCKLSEIRIYIDHNIKYDYYALNMIYEDLSQIYHSIVSNYDCSICYSITECMVLSDHMVLHDRHYLKNHEKSAVPQLQTTSSHGLTAQATLHRGLLCYHMRVHHRRGSIVRVVKLGSVLWFSDIVVLNIPNRTWFSLVIMCRQVVLNTNIIPMLVFVPLFSRTDAHYAVLMVLKIVISVICIGYVCNDMLLLFECALKQVCVMNKYEPPKFLHEKIKNKHI